MDEEYKHPHPDQGVHNARMMKHAEIHNAAMDELKRQGVSETAIETGARGGRYTVSSSGLKHYVGNNEHHDKAQTRGPGPWQR
jgi:hypothetical protein